MAGESGLECQTCQAVTGFAHDFRDDAARADPVRPERKLSGPTEAELGEAARITPRQSLPNVLLSESGIASGRLNIDVAELFRLWQPIALPPR